VERQADLFEVVKAAHPVSGLADLLDGRQQQAHEYGDDGDDDEQLNQRERATGAGTGTRHR